MISVTSGSVACLFFARTAFTAVGSTSYYLEPGLVASAASSRWSLCFSTDGVRLGTFDGGGWDAVTAACATGGWHLAQARWNSTTIEVCVDAGSWQTDARVVDVLLNNIIVGQNYSVGYFDGKILEVMTSQSRLGDSDFTSIGSYTQTRYGLSLGFPPESSPINGDAAVTFSQTGTVLGSATCVGTSPLAFTQSGSIKGAATCVGTSSATFTATGTLAGRASCVGTSAVVFTASLAGNIQYPMFLRSSVATKLTLASTVGTVVRVRSTVPTKTT